MLSAVRWLTPWQADLRSLAAMRIATGLCLLGDLGTRIGSHRMFLTDAGVLPRSALPSTLEATPHLGWYFLSGEAWWTLFSFSLSAVCAVLFTLGCGTRLFGVLSWLLLASLHARNGVVLQGGDSILLLALFWSTFLPLARVWSIDAAVRNEPGPTRVLNAGTVAMTLQLFAIYFVSGILKHRMGYWRRGEGVYNALSADHFVTPFGAWLYPFEDLLTWMSFGTLVLEIFVPFLLFVPFCFGPVRTALVFAFIAFHAGLGLSLDLGLFPWVSAAVWTFALPSWFWDQASRRLPAAVSSARAVASFGERTLAWLVRLRRKAFAATTGLRELASRARLSRALQLACVAALAYGAMLAVGELEREFAPKGALDAPRRWLKLSQGWRMFVPPYRDAGWFVAEGTRADGSTVDVLFGRGGEVSWERPRYVAREFPDQRWRKYLVNLRKPRFAGHRRRLAAALCRDWNDTHAGDEAIVSVEIVYLKRTIGLHYRRGAVERDRWVTQRCRQ